MLFRSYGCFEANRRWAERVRRPLLHAALLGFPELPSLAELSGRTFHASLPEDMRSFAAEWGWDDRDLD